MNDPSTAPSVRCCGLQYVVLSIDPLFSILFSEERYSSDLKSLPPADTTNDPLCLPVISHGMGIRRVTFVIVTDGRDSKRYMRCVEAIKLSSTSQAW
jgi:hypothetical protein